MGRSGLTNAAKIECCHRRARKLLTDCDHRILTFHSIYDYFALLKAFNTNTLNFRQDTIYLLIYHLICTTLDTERILTCILHFLIIQKQKNIFVSSNSYMEQITKFA